MMLSHDHEKQIKELLTTVVYDTCVLRCVFSTVLSHFVNKLYQTESAVL